MFKSKLIVASAVKFFRLIADQSCSFTELETPKEKARPAAVKKGTVQSFTLYLWHCGYRALRLRVMSGYCHKFEIFRCLKYTKILPTVWFIDCIFVPDGTAMLREKTKPAHVKKGTCGASVQAALHTSCNHQW